MVSESKWPTIKRRQFPDFMIARGDSIIEALRGFVAMPADEITAYALIAIACELLSRDERLTRDDLQRICAKIIDTPEKQSPEANTRGT